MFRTAAALEPRAATSNSSKAFSLTPSGNFDGNDGAWSTFVVRVGTPAQLFRILPSTNGLETWIPIPDHCDQGQSWCGNARGVMPYNGASSGPYSGSPNEVLTTSLDPGLTCTANRSPMCINCISINGKCTDGACTGRNCCGDPAGNCNGQGCNGLNGICTGPYIGCPCVGPDFNIGANSPSSSGQLDAVAASGFASNQSSTWAYLGRHRLVEGEYLNITIDGQYGTDVVGLGVDESTGLTLNRNVVAGIMAEPFYTGTFGLKAANVTSIDGGPATFMAQLKQQNLIQSISYGYTAGAIYRQPSVLGSLTLGGYDASRSLPNNLTFSLAGNDSASPVVGIKSIAASDTLANDVTILSEGIIALIDTALPFIWLPLSACQVFENAFGLTWNDSKDLYLINQTSHQQLLSKDPSIDFILENLASGPSINITLPYSSFNLQASNPIFPNGTNYLPLKRATSPSQYTLGRTFMQEAFMFVDYEQGNFSISQAQFPSNPSPNLVTVDHSAQPVESSSPVSSTTKHSISHGALAGAVVGSLLAFTLLCAIAIFFFRRHRQRQQKSQHRDSTTTSKSSAPGKESWPSSPSNSQAPGYLSPQSNLESGSETLTSMDRSTEKPPSTVGELEDPMTAVTAPSINWPAPSRPRQELPGCDTAKELPPTPRDREKHIFELAQ